MADFLSKVSGEVKQQPDKAPTIHEKEFGHSLVDSRYTNHRSLLSNVTGSPRACTYYRQVRGKDEEPVTFQLNGMNVYQSYIKVNKLIIKVDGSESYSFDNETGESSSTLEAYCMFDLVPMKGDVLYMDSGDGRAGFYQVIEQPQLHTYAKDKVYKISLHMLCFVDEKILNTLNSRVIKEYFYSADSILNGGSAIIVKDDFFLEKDILEEMALLTQYYMKKFYYEPEKTLNLYDNNNANYNIYDQYLVKFCKCVIPSEFLTGLRTFEYYDIRSNLITGSNQTLSVWDAFLKLNTKLLKIVDRDMWLISVKSLPTSAYYGNLFYSKFNYFISNNPNAYKRPYITHSGFFKSLVVNVRFLGFESEYVFSDDFYEGNKELMDNEWERFFYETLDKKLFDKKQILEFANKVYELDEPYQFYYIPILIWFMNKSRYNNSEYVV